MKTKKNKSFCKSFCPNVHQPTNGRFYEFHLHTSEPSIFTKKPGDKGKKKGLKLVLRLKSDPLGNQIHKIPLRVMHIRKRVVNAGTNKQIFISG